ncbi:unnamed protein product [Lymnaea stagnalis]|uniref:WW domain-containing protein n=1 Tax=Lymnaea stagnalis TaxID=6523 RepID=A0AAV2IKZ4_LYMST
MMASGHTPKTLWIPPLPQGWEARYDQSRRAYFFINHQTRTTQWEDPRFPQPVSTTQSNATAAFQSLGQIGEPNENREANALQLQDFNRTSHSKTRKGSDTDSVKSESSFTNKVNTASVEKLRAEFPNVTKELVGDILMICHNNEREAREQLQDLGFSSTQSSGASSSLATPQRTHSGSSSKGKTSSSSTPKRTHAAGGSSGAHSSLSTPHRPTSSTSPKKQVKTPPNVNPNKKKQGKQQQPQQQHHQTQQPAKEEVSESDKTRAFNQLKNTFPTTDSDVIRIALGHCNYDLTETTVLVSAWVKKQGEDDLKLAQAREASLRATSDSVSAAPRVSLSGSLEPAGIEDAAANRPQGFGSAQPNTHRPGPRPGTKSTTNETSDPSHSGTGQNGASGGDAAAGGASDSSQARGHHHANAQQVTRMSEHLLNTTNDLLNHLATTASCCSSEEEEIALVESEETRTNRPENPPRAAVVTSQPTVVNPQPTKEENLNFVSHLRIDSKGPDAKLCKGPDSSLLTSDYTQANGPDRSLRAGPDPSHRTGPKGAQGPDASLRCGPQMSLLHKLRSIPVESEFSLITQI